MSNVSNVGFRGIWPIVFGSALGISIHSLLAGAGVSALLTHSPNTKVLVQLIGAAFLAYLGVKLFLTGVNKKQSKHQINDQITGFKLAFLLNLTNARAIILYMTVIPIFAGGELSNFLMLSTVHVLILTVWIIVVAFTLIKAKENIQPYKLRKTINTAGGLALIYMSLNIFNGVMA